MKPLLPILKEKKRYVVFEIVTEKYDKEKTQKLVESACLKFMGENGYSKAGIMVLKDSWKKNKGVIKVNTKYLDEVKMSLGLIKSNSIVNVIGVSGTLNKAKQKFM
ncbi:hypothetical protein K8R33_00230 [archaeon]|nr:hypothetical protein [archaeon]